METIIQRKRIEARLTLRELARALESWRGFSRARLSLAERGLINIPASDKAVILEVIERLAPLHKQRRRIVAVARDMDFAPFVADMRDRCAAAYREVGRVDIR